MEDSGGQEWKQEGQFEAVMEIQVKRGQWFSLGWERVVVRWGQVSGYHFKVEPSGPADRLDSR